MIKSNSSDENFTLGGKKVKLSDSYQKMEWDSIHSLIVEENDSIVLFTNNSYHRSLPKPIKLINYINDVQQNKDTLLKSQEGYSNLVEIIDIGPNGKYPNLNLTQSEKELFFSSGKALETKDFYVNTILSNKDSYSLTELLFLYKSLYTGTLLYNETPLFTNTQLTRIKTTMDKFPIVKGMNNEQDLYYYGMNTSEVILMGKKGNQYFISEFSIDSTQNNTNRIKNIQSKYHEIFEFIK